QTITINNIDFSNNSAFTLDELNVYPVITYPIVLAPGDEVKYHITFTPIPSMTTVNELVNVSSDYPTAISIPITATVIQPPVVTTDSAVVRLTVEQSDSAIRTVKMQNTGLGDLDYRLSIEYHRPGISYSSVTPAKPVKNTVAKKNLFTLYGSGQPVQLTGSGGSALDYPAGGFKDSVLAFDAAIGTQYVDFLGTGVDEPSVMAVSRFNGGQKGIYLSHVGNLYRTDNMIPATIKFRIRLGSNINNSTVIYEQSVDVQPDTTGTGTYIVVKLDSGILINAYEDFWIEWDYAFGMRFPQGFQYVTTDQFKPQTFYYRATEQDAFQEIYWMAAFYMAAYAQTDSTGGWLTLTPDNGTLGINLKQPLKLTVHGPKTTPPDQSADIVIHSNDPVTPEAKVGVYLHIDQAPVLTSHDTLVVHEADTLYALIPAVDDGGGKVKISLVDKNSKTAISKTDSGTYFIYRPDYDDAGLHNFAISLADTKGNKRNDSLIVLVINTNRPPIVVKHLKNRTISLDGPGLTLALDTVFLDPDGDAVTYGFAGDANPMVQVFVKPTGETGIIQKDTGHISLPFVATDVNGASGYDTLHLWIKVNKAPVSNGIPYVFLEKGLTQIVDLSNYFSDEDPGDVLTYTAVVDSSQYVRVEVQGSNLIIHGLTVGNCIVTVTADDGSGGTVTKSFIVEVVSKMGDSGYDYHIRIAPNPIHGTAAALFLMDKEKRVQIQLLNMDGRVRQTLFEGSRPAGFNSVLINLHGVPMGNYYVKFTLGNDIRVVQITKL
ncbi:MAG TPA: hypothetical protein VII28_15065, partial [Puia sp.]